MKIFKNVILTDSSSLFLRQPVIPEELIESHKKEIEELIEEQQIGVELRVGDFDDHIHLINGEVRICHL